MRSIYSVCITGSLSKQHADFWPYHTTKEEFYSRVPSDAILVGLKNCVGFHMVLGCKQIFVCCFYFNQLKKLNSKAVVHSVNV